MTMSYFQAISPLVLSACTTGILAILAWRKHHIPGSHAFAVMMLAFTEWTIALIVGMSSTHLSAALFWNRMTYIGMEIAPLTWLIFASQYAGNGRWLTPRFIAMLAILPACVFLLLWTNDLHHFFYTEFHTFQNGAVTVFTAKYGCIFWINVIYLYSLILLGLALILQTFARPPAVYRGQLAVILTGLAIPWLASLVDVMGYNPLANRTDLAPLALSLSGLVLFWGMARYKFLNLTPIARHAVLEEMTDGVIVLDMALQVVDVNRMAQQIIERATNEIIGHNIREAWPAAETVLQQLLTDAQQASDTAEYADQKQQWYDIRVSPVRNWHHEEIGYLLVLRDITELKRSELERAQLTIQLRQLQKLEAIGLLAGGMAHDINNLLVPIVGYTELAQLQAGTDNRLTKQLQYIHDAANHASVFTRQLLTFSRKQVLAMRDVNIAETFRDFIRILQGLVGKSYQLVANLETRVDTVSADPALLQQVLMNLVINARDAMPDGGEIHIELTNVIVETVGHHDTLSHTPGAYVLITVQDHGEGMDTETLSHIFEPFYTTKGQGKGTGLGLTMVDGIIKQHNGSISVESHPGQGTTVRILLPTIATINQHHTPCETPAGR
ncbi:MAG TPA: histidine kinase N-terminal 7TM domain-containing protein [Armatimonadota bacterium]|nr:histidine kinase N-terminal 7TM domain-containing protein [Armatimonadota bacterium]